MKYFVTLIAALFISAAVMSQTLGVSWSSPVNVGTGSLHNNIYPRITLTSGDTPVVVWEDNSPAKVYSARKSGSSFSLPIVVNPTGLSPFVANWAGAELSSSGDTVFIVFTSTPVLSGNAYIVRSVDGGMSYSDTVRVDQDSAKVPSFPSVIVLPGGNPIVNYMIADDGTMVNTEYVVSRSTDSGNTFLPSVLPVNPGNVCDCCPGSMAVSGNSVALLYRNNIGNIRDMWSSFSTDAGASFPVSSEIDTTDWLLMSCPSSGPSGVIIGDSLITTWMSGATGNSRIYLGTVNIADQQIGQQRQIYPVGTNTQNNPVIAGKGDTLGLVWLGYNGTSQEVLFTWSVTGAAGLGMKVDTLTKGLTGHQSRPDIAFNNGKFHIVYSNSVGTQVHYIEGTLTTSLSVNEEISDEEMELTAQCKDGSLEVLINSAYSCHANISIVNSLGQELWNQSVFLTSGENKFQGGQQLNNGIYFIVVKTNTGKTVQKKVCIIR
jgi:hypothetical protein